MKCKKCENTTFKIQITPCCGECEQNGAWDDLLEEYTYNLKTIESYSYERIQVSETGECKMGTAAGEGCHAYICSRCDHKDNLYLVEGR